MVGRSRSRALAARLAARRVAAIGMVMRGDSQAEVARRLHVTREAVRQWVESWRGGGLAALAPRPRIRPRRVELVQIADALGHARSGSDGPLSSARLRQIVRRRFGVTYCASSARSILHRLGYSFTREHGWQRTADRQRERPRRAS